MKPHGLIFGAESIRAFRDGRKTQTRRLVRHPERLEGLMLAGEEGAWCPHGPVGRPIYAKEAWGLAATGIVYRAEAVEDDSGERSGWWVGDRFVGPVLWRSPRFMRRDLARLWFRLAAVRAERLMEISEEDAKADGVEPRACGFEEFPLGERRPIKSYRQGYCRAWNELHGGIRSGGSPWLDNPIVWVYTLEPAERPAEATP